jgi:hypothetical protein
MSKREFNTPHREAWNAPIHHILKAIDQHMLLYFDSKDPWHLQQSELLRNYLHGLKTFIHRQEGKLD